MDTQKDFEDDFDIIKCLKKISENLKHPNANSHIDNTKLLNTLKENFDYTIMESAVEMNDEDLIKFLIDGNLRNNYREKLMKKAVKTNNENIMKHMYKFMDGSLTSIPQKTIIKWIEDGFLYTFVDEEYLMEYSVFFNKFEMFDYFMEKNKELVIKKLHEALPYIHKTTYEMFMRIHPMLDHEKSKELVDTWVKRFSD